MARFFLAVMVSAFLLLAAALGIAVTMTPAPDNRPVLRLPRTMNLPIEGVLPGRPPPGSNS